MRETLKIKVLDNRVGTEIPIPSYVTEGSAGFDLRACIEADVVINPGETVMIGTGIAIEIPSSNYAAFIYARSGLGVKHKVVPGNCVGVIDSDYRGEVMVGLHNYSDNAFTVKVGDRVAQMIIAPVKQFDIEVVENLTDTNRGSGGFGSTGLK